MIYFAPGFLAGSEMKKSGVLNAGLRKSHVSSMFDEIEDTQRECSGPKLCLSVGSEICESRSEWRLNI